MEPKPVNHPNSLAGQLHISADDTTRFGVYSTGTVKKHEIGTRHRIGDKVYKYGHTVAAVKACVGAFNTGIYRGITGGNVTARAIGDMWLDILLDANTGGATWFGTKNNMVGGLWSQPDNTSPQSRIITGHGKGADAATIKVYLDGPITRTMIATSFMEIAQNPYNQLTQAGNSYMSVMGVPTTVIASGSYGWFQTWGPTWMRPNITPFADNVNQRDAYFHNDGSVQNGGNLTVETGFQKAGFVMDATTGALDNPPFIFLQISPF